MENTDTSTKKPSRFQLFCNAIFFKNANPYERLLLAIALTFLTRFILCFLLYRLAPNTQIVILSFMWFLWCYSSSLAQGIIYKFFNLNLDFPFSESEKGNKKIVWLVLYIVFGLHTAMILLYIPYQFLFFPFGYLLISWLGFRERRPFAIMLSWGALILSIYAMIVTVGRYPFRPVPLFLSAILSPFLLMGSVVSVGKLKFHQKIVRVSFAIAAFCIAARMLMEYHAAKQVITMPARMEALLEDYRQKHGIPSPSCDESLLNEEPLKSVVSLTNALKTLPAWKQKYVYHQSDIQKQYHVVSVAGSELREAILALAAIPPRPVIRSYDYFTKNSSTNDLAQVLNDASHILAIELKACATQSDIIRQDNAAMASLRDWCLQNPNDVKKEGYSIERRRLTALACTLAQKRYSETEWLELLGDELDWRYVVASGYYAGVNSWLPTYSFQINLIMEFLDFDLERKYPTPPLEYYWLANCGENCTTFFPPLISFLAQNYVKRRLRVVYPYLLECIKLSLTESSTCTDREKLYNDIQKIGISSSWSKLFFMPYQIEDARRMAMLAWKIMEYSHEHQGVLPENLEQIGESAVSAVNNLPFVYEHGDIEVHANDDDFTTIRGFRLYVPNEKQTGSPNWKKARSSMMVPLE